MIWHVYLATGMLLAIIYTLKSGLPLPRAKILANTVFVLMFAAAWLPLLILAAMAKRTDFKPKL